MILIKIYCYSKTVVLIPGRFELHRNAKTCRVIFGDVLERCLRCRQSILLKIPVVRYSILCSRRGLLIEGGQREREIL